MHMEVSFTETSNPAKCFMLRFLFDACGCFTQITFIISSKRSTSTHDRQMGRKPNIPSEHLDEMLRKYRKLYVCLKLLHPFIQNVLDIQYSKNIKCRRKYANKNKSD